jgi:hypothetical protein
VIDHQGTVNCRRAINHSRRNPENPATLNVTCDAAINIELLMFLHNNSSRGELSSELSAVTYFT